MRGRRLTFHPLLADCYSSSMDYIIGADQ